MAGEEAKEELAGKQTNKLFSYTTPSNYPKQFKTSLKRQKGDLVPYVVYADYRIFMSQLVDFTLHVPAMCTFGAPYDRLATLQQTGVYYKRRSVSSSIDVQCITELWDNEGVNGLFCGNGVHILQELLHRASCSVLGGVLFGLFPTGAPYLIITTAELLSRFITYPLSTIHRRIQITKSSEDRSIIGNIRAVIRKKGVLGLWSGFFSSFLLDTVFQRIITTILIDLLPFHATINIALSDCAFRAATHSLQTVIKIKQTSDLWPSYKDIFSAYGSRIYVNGLGASCLSSCFSIFGVFLSSYITRLF